MTDVKSAASSSAVASTSADVTAAKGDDWWTVAIPVWWGDMDANGHVNNCTYVKWIEHARVEFARVHLGTVAPGGFPDGITSTLGSVSCRFVRSVQYPDAVHVRTRVLRAGTSSLTLAHEIESAKLGVAATGESVMVFIHAKTGKSAAIPPRVRSKL